MGAPKFKNPWEQVNELKYLVKLLTQKVLYLEQYQKIQAHTYTMLMLDSASIACADVFKMGPGRALRWRDAVEDTLGVIDKLSREEMNRHIDYKGKVIIEGDEYISATREQIDRRLQSIYGAAFSDFETRYQWRENKEFFDNYEKVNKAMEQSAGQIKAVVDGRY